MCSIAGGQESDGVWSYGRAEGGLDLDLTKLRTRVGIWKGASTVSVVDVEAGFPGLTGCRMAKSFYFIGTGKVLLS